MKLGYILFGLIVFPYLGMINAQTELCEEGFELVNGICQMLVETTDVNVSYVGGYVEMIIPILLLVITSIVAIIYYKKLKPTST